MKAVIFDFFGVICDEIAPFVLPRYMTVEESVRYKATIVDDADRGKISQAEMFEALGKIAHAPAAELESEFWKYVRLRPETVDLITDLKAAGYQMGLLTNAIVPFLRQITAKFALEPLFDTILVSAEEGLAKPDAAYFRRLLEKMQVDAKDAVFLDDNPVNIRGAESVGLNTILFTDAAAARADLKKMGIAA